MKLEVLKAGLATTIQDMGRIGFAEFGVPKSGAMDEYSASFANLLLGNGENSALMEIYLQGPKLKFCENTVFSVAGPGAEMYLNGNQIVCNRVFQALKNEVLEIKSTTGSRVYLAVPGGFQTEIVLESRSMCDGITSKSILQKGDVLSFQAYSSPLKKTFSNVHFEVEKHSGHLAQAFPGPEFDLLSQKAKKALNQNEFTISKDANRMACPLEEPLKNNLENILTGPVLPGTIQLTPSGKLIVLMRDCQSTGGYPRILQLSGDSQNLLAQKKPGDKIEFKVQDIEFKD